MTMRSLFDGALTMILYVLAFAAGTVFVRANYGPSALLGHRFTVVLARQVIAGGF